MVCGHDPSTPESTCREQLDISADKKISTFLPHILFQLGFIIPDVRGLKIAQELHIDVHREGRKENALTPDGRVW
jgi:hypothetical protein